MVSAQTSHHMLNMMMFCEYSHLWVRFAGHQNEGAEWMQLVPLHLMQLLVRPHHQL